MLEVAKKRATDIGLHASLSIMDAEQLCFPNDSFDTVVESMTMCTFPNPVKALHEMARVCRDGGRILLFEHGHSNTDWIARYQDRHAQQHANSLGCR